MNQQGWKTVYWLALNRFFNSEYLDLRIAFEGSKLKKLLNYAYKKVPKNSITLIVFNQVLKESVKANDLIG